MDPLATIGLFSNIITFIEFGYEVVAKAKEIRNAATDTGTSASNQTLVFLTQHLQNTALSLQENQRSVAVGGQGESLSQLAVECQQTSQDLLSMLEKLRPRDPTSIRSSLKEAFREMRGSSKDLVHNLQKRLDQLRQQINLELTSLARSESQELSSKLMQHVQLGHDNLASLTRKVESLRSGVTVNFLSPEALEQIRLQLSRCGETLTKERENRILEALRFDLMDERFHDVEEAHKATFDWIFGDATSKDLRKVSPQMSYARLSFNEWLEHGSGIFHISGKPGAGKSTLMKYLCQSPNTQNLLQGWAGHKALVFSKFFFWRPGTTLQKSLSGLIRGLLYYLLLASPNLIPIALPGPWEQSSVQKTIHLEPDAIRKGFDAVTSSQEIHIDHKFAFFIDGLDEFTGNHIELIRQLFEWTGRVQTVKICVSSREWTIFQERFRGCPSVRLQELTRSDIERVVKDRLREASLTSLLQEAGRDVKKLERSIIDGSDGVFLWVKAVLLLVEDGLLNGDLMHDLQRKINSLPTELEAMYRNLFDSIPQPDQRIAYLVLHMALTISKTQGGHCCLSRYSFLDDYLNDRNFAIALPTKLLERPLITKQLMRARRRVYGVCKGFLEIIPYSADTTLPKFAGKRRRTNWVIEAEETNSLFGGAVKFTHRSAVEFLSSKPILQQLDYVISKVDTFDACCQTLLAQVKTISMHRQGLCFSDAASHIKTIPQLGDFRTGIVLYLYYTERFSTKRESTRIPVWFSDNLIDVARFAAMNIDLNTDRFEQFIINVVDAVAAFTLPTRYVCLLEWLIDGLCGYSFSKIHVSAIPTLVMVAAGLPLSRSTLTPAITLYALLQKMGQVTLFGNQLQASSTLHNLRLYLDTYGTPNEGFRTNEVPAWHFYLWRSCWLRPTLAVIALFLYYGANPWFWINAAEVMDDNVSKKSSSSGPPGSKSVMFWYESGTGSTQSSIFGRVSSPSPRRIRPSEKNGHWQRKAKYNSPEYIEFWSKHNNRISFRELVQLWFPTHASQLLPVIDWLINQNGEVSALQDKFGAGLRPLFDTIEEWRSIEELVGELEPSKDSFGSMVVGEKLYTGR